MFHFWKNSFYRLLGHVRLGKAQRPIITRSRGRTSRPAVERLEDRTAPAISILGGGTGYAGLDYGQSGGFVPPDTSGAAGPTAYVETVNSTIALYPDKNTGASPVTMDLITFFSGLPDQYGFQFDPAVMFHDNLAGLTPDQGRFIVISEDADISNGLSVLDIAVSKTPTPANLTSDWYFFQITTDNSGDWADYPGNPGYNEEAVVVTFNMFDSSGNFSESQIVAISVNDLINGTGLTLDTNYFRTFDSSYFSLRPTTMHDAVAGDPMWIVTEGAGNSLDVIRMTNVLTTSPTFTNFNVAVNAYSPAIPPLNPDGSDITTNIDSRLIKAAMANDTLVASHTVSISATEDTARWYIIDVSSGTPTLTDQGDHGGGADTYFTYPAIDINLAGQIGMTYMRSGDDTATDFMSMYVTGRQSSDPPGTMQTPILVPAGTGAADNVDGRAGDLSGISVDPVDGTFWAASEFTDASAEWGTAIANFSLVGTTVIRIDASGNLVVEDFIATKPDNLTIQADVANSQYIIADPTVTSTIFFLGSVPGATISADAHTAFIPFGTVTGTQIIVNTIGGADSLVIDDSLGAFPLQINYDGGLGIDSLTGPNQNNLWTVTATSTGEIVGVASFTRVQNLIGNTMDDVFQLSDDVGVTGFIDGKGGENTLDYSAYSANTSVTVNRGNASATNLNLGGPGGFFNIQNLLGGAAMDTLIGADVASTWDITGTDAGDVNNTFTFTSMEKLTGGSARDIFDFGFGFTISGQLNGGGGSNTLIAPDVDNVWMITAINQGTLTPAVSSGPFLSIQNLTGGAAQDQFIFANNAASVAGKITGGGQIGDTIDYTAYTTGPVAVNLAAGTATLTGGVSSIYYFIGNASGMNTFTGNNSNNTWVINADNSGTATTFQFMNFTHLNGGAAQDIFNFSSGATIGQLNGGGGVNTLIGPNVQATWQIIAPNQGYLTPVIVSLFKNIQNLTGGTLQDVFVFGNGAVMSGKLNGGGGSNWLNYSAFRSKLTINLKAGTHSAAKGGVANFNNILGSAVGGDRLTGGATGGVLIGHGAANTITGGGGVSVLIGGYGKNVVIGGSANDLIINGKTSYDYSVSAQLLNIITVWQSNMTYAQKVATLSANVLVVTKTVTVFPPRRTIGPSYGRGTFLYQTVVVGNGGQDWFITSTLSSVADKKRNETVTLR